MIARWVGRGAVKVGECSRSDDATSEFTLSEQIR